MDAAEVCVMGPKDGEHNGRFSNERHEIDNEVGGVWREKMTCASRMIRETC